MVLFFGRHFQTDRRIDANDMPLKNYGYCAHLLSLRVFQIPYSFKTILEIVHSVFTFFSYFVLFFGHHLKTAGRIDANNMPLESYGKCATFLSLVNFEIPNGLRAVLKLNNTVF